MIPHVNYAFGSGANAAVDIAVGEADRERSSIGIVRFDGEQAGIRFNLLVESRATGDHEIEVQRPDEVKWTTAVRLPPTQDRRKGLTPTVVTLAAPDARVRILVRGPRSVDFSSVEVVASGHQIQRTRRGDLTYGIALAESTKNLLRVMMQPGDIEPVVEAGLLSDRSGKTVGTITNWGRVAMKDLCLDLQGGHQSRLRYIAEQARSKGLLPYADE